MDLNVELRNALALELAKQGLLQRRALITAFIEGFIAWGNGRKRDMTYEKIVERARELKRTKYGKEG